MPVLSSARLSSFVVEYREAWIYTEAHSRCRIFIKQINEQKSIYQNHTFKGLIQTTALSFQSLPLVGNNLSLPIILYTSTVVFSTTSYICVSTALSLPPDHERQGFPLAHLCIPTQRAPLHVFQWARLMKLALLGCWLGFVDFPFRNLRSFHFLSLLGCSVIEQ